jgi:streptomycin 6-kinase
MVFESNIKNVYGVLGEVWLKSLPELVDKFANKYGLTGLVPVKNLSYNYVLFGLRAGQNIVLKLSLNVKELEQEAETLKAFAGHGSVKLLEQASGALLIECASPGNTLRSYFPLRDDESVGIVCDLMRQIHKAPIPAGRAWQSINDWLCLLDKELDIPSHYIQKARSLRDQLLATSGPPMLLHGDLHHDNILQKNASWAAIDPQGIIGEAAYELGAFIRNPIPELLNRENAIEIIMNRVSIFSNNLGIDKERIQLWNFVQAVLSWAWDAENNLDTKYFERLTKVFHDMMQ